MEAIEAKSTHRSVRAAVAGVLAAFGAPCGWLLVRLAFGDVPSVSAELREHALLYAYLLTGTSIAFGLFGFLLGRISDRLAAAARHLEHLAAFDELTGVLNARSFRERLPGALSVARLHSAPLSLVVVDLDFFKRVNDSHGHSAGDLVLERTAHALKECARAGDEVFRIGGEEFAVLCPATTARGAAELADRMRLAVESSPIQLDGASLGITASFGVAALERRMSSGSLFRSADAALYEAKRTGRNRVVVAGAEQRAAEIV